MQRIQELSHEELVKLNDEELQRFVDIEIAYAGIKMANPVTLRPVVAVDLKATECWYQVNETIYKTKEEAMVVAGVAAFRETYDYNGAGYDYRYAEPREAVVTTKFLYSRADVDAARSTLKANREAKEYNDKMKAEYDKYLAAVDAVRLDTLDVYNRAMEIERAVARAMADYQKYLTLANGDQAIADGFFTNAYKDELESVKSIAMRRIKSGIGQVNVPQ